MFIAALHTTAKIGKQPQFPLMNKWIKKLWCVCVFAYICIHIYAHTHRDVEYYSAIKNEEILPFATTWMDLKGIVLSAISAKNPNKLIEKEVISVVTRSGITGRGNWRKIKRYQLAVISKS